MSGLIKTTRIRGVASGSTVSPLIEGTVNGIIIINNDLTLVGGAVIGLIASLLIDGTVNGLIKTHPDRTPL